MGMLDCDKCWDVFCECGYQWKDMSRERRISLASAILGITKEYIEDKIGNTIPDEHPQKNRI